jgi:ketosteroid isomerase-like protein
MSRTPQEIFAHHAGALVAQDVEELVADFADDAVFISPHGSGRGKDGARKGFSAILADLPGATFDVPTQVFEGDVLFLTWSAVSEAGRVTDGVDTLVFDDEGIRVQTVSYTLEPVV